MNLPPIRIKLTAKQKRQAREKQEENLRRACQSPFYFRFRILGQVKASWMMFGLYPKKWVSWNGEQRAAWWKELIDHRCKFSLIDASWELLSVVVPCFHLGPAEAAAAMCGEVQNLSEVVRQLRSSG